MFLTNMPQIQTGGLPLIETCAQSCLIILLLPSILVVATGEQPIKPSGTPNLGANLQGPSIVCPSSSQIENPTKIFRSANEHKRRRYEYSKPDKHFKWDTRKWVKDYGSISRRRIRRSAAPAAVDRRASWMGPPSLPEGWKKSRESTNNKKNNVNHLHFSYDPVIHKPQEQSHQHPVSAKKRKELQKAAVGNQKAQKILRDPSTRDELESVLDVAGVECGKVPIYENLYHRSINESYEVDPETGDFRILHGLDSVVGEWPWIVRITECLDIDSCATCTGTLLNDKWIITAGHCAFNQTDHPERYTASFGLYDLVSPESTSFTVPIEKMIVHPDYNDLNNDLTLMRLAKPVEFSDMIKPACLVRPTRNLIEYARGKRCYAVGYGLIDGMDDAIKLQKLEIRAKQASECNSYELGAVQLKPGTVCIGPPPGKMGSSCKGDSGGPNLCYDPKLNSWHIIATVSYGPPNCDRENDDSWLTVSVDLSNYRTWILSTILANSE